MAILPSFAIVCLLSLVAPPRYTAELVFPLHDKHNHAPGIVECPNGDLLVSWYRGSGERSADDVAVYGSWKRKGMSDWSAPFVMADRPGFPDCNTCMFIDADKRLWLFWPTIIANTWESCFTNYLSAVRLDWGTAPVWDREGLILLKPDDFQQEAQQLLDEHLQGLPAEVVQAKQTEINEIRQKLGNKLFQRLGWQPRCKPTQLPNGRLLLPLYSDTFSISIMAISDDQGATWFSSKPLIGFGNIQPTVLRRNDGTLVAYMRENGIHRQVRVAESSDEGVSWGKVAIAPLPNPGSGVDGLRLQSGNWILVYNDTQSGRNRLAVSWSSDEGRTWTRKRYLENQPRGSYHYPAVTQGADGTIHFVYSYFVDQGKSMKHVAVNEEWLVEETKE